MNDKILLDMIETNNQYVHCISVSISLYKTSIFKTSTFNMTNVKMENGLKIESNVTKKYISKLHEKMISKYEDMQRKLEKSKSIDMLPNLNDDYNFRERKRFMSVSDLRTGDEEFNGVSENQNYSTSYQDKHKDIIFEEIVYNKATIVEADSISNLSEKIDEVEYTEDNEFFNKNFFNTSLESLNEVIKESDESSEPQTPSPKSFRDRIELRLKKRQTEKARRAQLKRKESRQKIEKFILSNSSKAIQKVFKKTKIGTLTIALIDVKGLEDLGEEKSRVLIFRFRLGAEKRKTKVVKSNNTEVKFQELFSLSLFDDDHLLEGTLWDKDIFMGRCVVNLLNLEKERTHQMRVNLDGEFKNIQCFFLLTISGTTLMNIAYDLDEYEKKETQYLMEKKYAWYRLCDQFSNVGVLSVLVYGAKGLSGQDCYCVLNLNNERIQTQTDYKTNDPSWMKIITFKLTDITSILEVTIFDEKKNEEIGKVLIPLLKIKSGKKWFALKDSTLKEKAKGNNPRILLEMFITWNLIKAAVRVINKKEVNYLETDEKLDRHVFSRNLTRAKAVTSWVLSSLRVAQTCFEWESRKSNIIALVIWIQFCLFAKMWMMPLLLLIPFFLYKPNTSQEVTSNNLYIKNDKEDKNVSIRQRINSFQEILLTIQNLIGKIANIGESVKNLFNFTVPFVSFLSIFFIIIITLVMYLIPLNYICLFWGIHKFTRKILRPNRIPNNEILDILSRVPDDETLMECEELPLGELSEDEE